MINLIKRFFVSLILFMIISFPGFSADNLNTLSEITVNAKGTEYILTLSFADKFTESAFVQKQEDGYFHIFIPDAVLESDNLPIKYKVSKKVYKPQIDLEQRRYVKNNSDSKYIRIDVFTDDDASISVITENFKSKLVNNILKSALMLFLFTLVVGTLYLLYRFLPEILFKKKYNTFVPESFSESSVKGYKTYKRTLTVQDKEIKESLFDTVLTSGLSDFRCFDIQDKINAGDKKLQIESTISKAKEISFSEKQTNPLVMNIFSDLSEFSAHAGSGSKEVKNDEEEYEKDELVSLLNVTPTKGFVLKREKGKYCLYSFNAASERLIKTFDSLKKYNLQARYYDKNNSKDIYIVRIDDYKSMVEFSDNDVKELTVL